MVNKQFGLIINNMLKCCSCSKHFEQIIENSVLSQTLRPNMPQYKVKGIWLKFLQDQKENRSCFLCSKIALLLKDLVHLLAFWRL